MPNCILVVKEAGEETLLTALKSTIELIYQSNVILLYKYLKSEYTYG